jgi:hypothetical protein
MHRACSDPMLVLKLCGEGMPPHVPERAALYLLG